MGKLTAFMDLKPNWDSYGALPIDPACVTKAEVIMALMPIGDGWAAVPTATGGVQLEQHAYGLDIEISIERSQADGGSEHG